MEKLNNCLRSHSKSAIELTLTPRLTSNASAFYTTHAYATTTRPRCLLRNWGPGKCGMKAKVDSQIGCLGQVIQSLREEYSKRRDTERES